MFASQRIQLRVNFIVYLLIFQSGDRHQVRYIPPRSIDKYSNIAKQRSELNIRDIPNKMSQGSRFELQLDKELEVEQNGRHRGCFTQKQKNTRNKMTMVDLIMQETQLKKGKEVVDYQPYQDIEHDEPQLDSAEDVPSDSDGDKSFDFNDETLFDLSKQVPHNEQEATEDESEQVDLDSQDLEIDAISEEKTRGPTMLHHVHTRPLDERKAIILNELGQPIGPITSKDNTVAEFSHYLGPIARDYKYAPLIFDSWRKVPHKDKMWEYISMKYIVPDEGKDWVIRTIGDTWRIHKCRFKKTHYYAYNDDKTRWKNRSKRVPDQDFLKLLSTWKKKSEKVRCSRKRHCRLSVRNMHTAGPKSFATIREEMRNEHLNKEPPSLAELFERTRKRNEGKNYKESYQDTAKKIDDMKNYACPDDGSGPSDSFLGVMGKDYNGRCRLYGRGVSNKKLKMLNGTTSSFVVPGEVMESLKSSLLEDVRKDMIPEITRLQDIRKEMEEDHLKKKEELENKQRELDSERESMTQQILQKLLEKLPPEVVRQYLL
ncbi:hypothetical protein RND81_13G076100 [Saponaria officinalis]|uniref:Transposase, Ptta/En/Spm n=1 Tax=Saponaria officinalis TaxID=3572 RepID=A0AAW1GUX8_SAPOF